MFRAVFKNEHGEWNTFRYFWQGDTASNDEFEGSNEAIIATNYKFGILNVRLWPAYAEQSPDQIINESDSATFRAYGAALDDGTKISVKWQYSTPKYVDSNGKEVFDWHYISDDNEFGGLQNEEVDAPVVVTPSEVDYALHGVAPDNNLDLFHEKAVFHGVETRLTVRKVDITQNGTHFRAEFKAVTAYGTEYVWYSDIADNFSGSWNTDNGSFGNYGRVAVEDNSNKMTITDKAPLDLLRGEMSMNMFGTQLVPGANAPANPERWVVAADESEGVDGVFLHLPLECFIAGGNVNDETVCTPVTKVQYTIAEYGKTVPELDDVELPDYIHGEPVTPSTTG